MSLCHDGGFDQFLGLGGQDEALEGVLIPRNIGNAVNSYEPCERENARNPLVSMGARNKQITIRRR